MDMAYMETDNKYKINSFRNFQNLGQYLVMTQILTIQLVVQDITALTI